MRIPAITTINAYGWFDDTKKGAVLEAIINITVSLALLPKLGMQGLLLGTVCSYLFRTQDVIRFVYRKCKIGWGNFFKNIIANLIGFILLLYIFFYLKPLDVTGWLDWVIKALRIFLLSITIFFLLNYLPSRKEYNQFFKKYLKILFK